MLNFIMINSKFNFDSKMINFVLNYNFIKKASTIEFNLIKINFIINYNHLSYFIKYLSIDFVSVNLFVFMFNFRFIINQENQVNQNIMDFLDHYKLPSSYLHIKT